ncbi:MAG: response regulator [Lachnospiraceae bacterium]|jgi:signal transduction histidine kinase/ActR/RegA family two-component response regulator|nr:response regulator [Lachnospiraceae bacterium]
MEHLKEPFEQTGEEAQIIETREQYSDMRSVQNLEAVINEGLRAALLRETPDQSLEVLLEHLGKALHGERTYIFEQNASGGDDNTYEWAAEGVKPEKENLQNVPAEVCASWYRNFSISRHIVIENLENIRETDPLQYENLEKQGIHSLVVVPLYDGKKIIGFYGVDNPPAKSLEYASNMLQTAAYFIVSSLKRRNLVRELQKRSYNVLHALSVDYLDIYQVNFDTGECDIYRSSEGLGMDWAAAFQDGYQTAMERYISEYVVPQDQERLRAMTKKDYVLAQLRMKKKFSVRYQVKDSSSGLKHLEIHFSATEKTKEENSAIFAQRDVNAVVEQEEKYKLEARRSLEDILEGARTGIWTIELEDGCLPRMYADRTMRILLGLSEEVGPEECYRHWFERIEPDYVEMAQEAVREILESGRSEVIYPWNHPTLGKIYVRCGGVSDKTFKKPGACLNGYHQDITETMMTRKKQEQSIMELLERVRQANSAKSEFLSHMSHDLRTPINGILGMLGILEKSQDDLERQKECRKKIRVSTEHLLSLVNDVLLVSKLESGRPAAVEEPFDLCTALEDCITIQSPIAQERGISLELEMSGLRHSKVIGNPLHLKQILMNVIDNALKYNRPNGSVFVRAEETAFQDGIVSFRFTIEDTGIGIGEEFKKHIFDIFTQEHQSARTNYNGVGLGMSIVKKLVDQMKGTVEIDSQIGKGSMVRITLSVRADETRSEQILHEEQSEQGDIAGMRVLLVEDNEINCEIVEYMLSEAGAGVVIANDGKAAVDAFTASVPGTFDCILMDLMMPVMSGYEAARVIRGLNRKDAESVPIIALSANAFEEDIALAKDAGMNEHLAKPVDTREMFRVMNRLRSC